MLDLSVVIPTSGRADDLIECLRSVERQDFHPERYEILVVANPLTRDLVENVNELGLPNVRILRSSPSGVGRARNLGLRQARGRIVLFLDDDCRLAETTHLRRRVLAHDENPENALLAGFYESPPRLGFWGRSYNEVTRLWLRRGLSLPDQSLFFLGGNFSLLVDEGVRALRFREDLLTGGEEADFAAQVRATGRICCLNAEFPVDHHSRHGVRSFLRRAWQHGKVREPAVPRASVFRGLEILRGSPIRHWGSVVLYGLFMYSGRMRAVRIKTDRTSV